MDSFKNPKIVHNALWRNQIKGTSISYLKDSESGFFFTFIFEMITKENKVITVLFPNAVT